MSRIYTQAGDKKPEINKDSVFDFFEKRAAKVDEIGPIRAVIYQDKNPNLAERRDAAEKSLLFPLMNLDRFSTVLDAGCGSGRWAEVIIPHCAAYFGVDVSPGLVRVARERFDHYCNARFSVCSIDNISLEAIGARNYFTHILSFGLFMYLNDDEVTMSLNRFVNMAAANAKVIFREPIAMQNRLTLQMHFSDDMEQMYNAIYRTEAELLDIVHATLGMENFTQIGCGDVFADASLNNRAETKQRWFLWERR